MMREHDKCPVDRRGECVWPRRCGTIGAAFLCLVRLGKYKGRPKPEFTPLSRRPKAKKK